MTRTITLGGLIVGALGSFGIATAIVYFLIWPELETSRVFFGGDVPWSKVGLLLAFAFLWLIAGLIAIYLLIDKSTTLTGHEESDIKPWLAYRDWASATIRSEVSFSFFRAWVFAVVPLLLTVGFYFLVRDIIAQGDYTPLLFLTPFGLVGLGMLIYAINVTRGWLRFGQMILILDPYPGSIGGHIGGQIDVRLPYNAENHIQVGLSCERILTTRRRGGKNNQRIDVIWNAKGLAHATSCPKGTRLSFRFEVPEDLPPSTIQSLDYHQWHVLLTARLPGADLDRAFVIPVFPTAESSSGIHFDSTEHSGYEDFNRVEASSNLKLSSDMDGGVVLKYPMFHREKAKGGAILSAVGLGCTLPGIAILMDETSGAGIAVLIVGLLFTLGGFYLLFHNLIVKMNAVRLQTTLKLLGIPIRRKEVPRSEVMYLIGGQFIKAIVKNGKAITISQAFPDDKVGNQALEAIVNWTGYPVKGKKKRKRRA